ncbi:hypothetical protein L0222_29795 [bacterium]|nr:hypothetical protein [bacterium]MCI0605019.1 hypothetical protein [bacterium]
MKYVMIVCFLIFVDCLAAAEEVPELRNPYGYVFGGLTLPSEELFLTLNSGVGFEYLFYKGLGINSEISFLAPLEDLTFGIGLFSVNGSYHFGEGESTPFLTAGYSLIFREGYANLFNIGGGFQRRLKSGHALRLEFRDHIMQNYRTFHFLSFRVGWTF